MSIQILPRRKHGYIVELFTIIRRKTIANQADETLEDTLSTLWCLTESSVGCGRVIAADGLKMFLMVLDKFAGVTKVEKRVMVLVMNMSRLPNLRHHLCDVAFLEKLDKLLESNCFKVSYYAADILLQLACQEVEGYFFPR